MLTFTLDTNCIIHIDEGRPAAGPIRRLANAHAAGLCDVSVVAVSASELQPGDKYIENFREFTDRLKALGLDHLGMTNGLAYCDLSFFDACLFAGDASTARERQIHAAMFPTIRFEWPDHAREKGVSADDRGRVYKKWRNAFCDRQMFWAHEHARRDVFVTSNTKDFYRLHRSPEFPQARVLTPDDAIALLEPVAP